MLSIKTNLNKLISSNIFTKNHLCNEKKIRDLMSSFFTDELGHRAKIKDADLGYGWLHYCFIKTIKPKKILCIGSRHGYIPAILAQACKENNLGSVDFVDPGYGKKEINNWTGVGYWKTEKGKQCFNKFGLKKWIKIYVQTSKEHWRKKKDQYDYIYIDGDHSYLGVKLDYKLFWPRLKKYGFMVFHDVCINTPKPEGIYGVNKFWKEITSSNSSIIFPYKESGLGIIQKINK